MAKKKAKWLEEATISQLLTLLNESLGGDEPDVKKAQKIVAELQERIPAESEDQTLSVEEAVAKLIESFNSGVAIVSEAYKAEIEAISGDDDSEAEEDDEEEEDEEAEDEDDAPDYEEMSQKELKALCRERGLKVNKSMKKADFIKLLEADDKE